MQWFVIEAANRPGELARHLDAVAKRGVNLSNLVGIGFGDRGGAGFYATDEAALRTALNDAGVAYREVSAVSAKLEDRAGTAAEAAKALGDAGVNIELFAPLGMSGQHVTFAIGVDDVDKARTALGDRVTEWSSPAAASSR